MFRVVVAVEGVDVGRAVVDAGANVFFFQRGDEFIAAEARFFRMNSQHEKVEAVTVNFVTGRW